MSIAKFDDKKKARELRTQGMAVPTIAKELGVSKSSVSLWVRDIPVPEKFTPEYRAERREEVKNLLDKIREDNRKERIASRKDRLVSGDGRWMIRAPEGYKGKTYIKGLYVYEHRYLMEQKLGRLLTDDEVVHHIDGNKLNNDPENLELKTREQHNTIHRKFAERVELSCTFCKIKFFTTNRILKQKVKSGQKNFFCCKSHQIRYSWKIKKLLDSGSMVEHPAVEAQPFKET